MHLVGFFYQWLVTCQSQFPESFKAAQNKQHSAPTSYVQSPHGQKFAQELLRWHLMLANVPVKAYLIHVQLPKVLRLPNGTLQLGYAGVLLI